MTAHEGHSLEECLTAAAPRYSAYGWIITKDLVWEKGDEAPTRVGTIGPSTVSPVTMAQLKIGKGRAFRMLDDDRIVYYYGRYIGPDTEDMFGPLWDLGTPDAGAVDIQYYEARKGWTSL